jgi:hypothetical protein
VQRSPRACGKRSGHGRRRGVQSYIHDCGSKRGAQSCIYGRAAGAKREAKRNTKLHLWASSRPRARGEAEHEAASMSGQQARSMRRSGTRSYIYTRADVEHEGTTIDVLRSIIIIQTGGRCGRPNGRHIAGSARPPRLRRPGSTTCPPLVDRPSSKDGAARANQRTRRVNRMGNLACVKTMRGRVVT